MRAFITFILFGCVLAFSNAQAEPKTSISVENVSSYLVLGLEAETAKTSEAIGAKLGEIYTRLVEFTQKNGIEVNGMPICINHEWGETYKFTAALPVSKCDIETGDIKAINTYSGKVVKCVSVGPYEESEAAYNQIDKYIADNGLEIIGEPWEVYVNDPTTCKPEEIITHIYFPVK